MKNQVLRRNIILLIILLTLSACDNQVEAPGRTPVEGWAVLAEKDDYSDVGMTDMLVDHIDIVRMREALIKQGWDPDQIHDLKEFTREDLQTELDWLEEKADSNDIVFLYVSSHGEYLRLVIEWNDFIADEWDDINSDKRILLIDSCRAARFTKPVRKDPEPHFSIASVDMDEFGWKGLEDEGLPIIGLVFTYYFVEALEDPAADEDGDGLVSVLEAVNQAEAKQRYYMHNVVFAVPEFLEGYHNLGVQPENDLTFPDVIVDDKIGEPLYLRIAPDQ